MYYNDTYKNIHFLDREKYSFVLFFPSIKMNPPEEHVVEPAITQSVPEELPAAFVRCKLCKAICDATSSRHLYLLLDVCFEPVSVLLLARKPPKRLLHALEQLTVLERLLTRHDRRKR